MWSVSVPGITDSVAYRVEIEPPYIAGGGLTYSVQEIADANYTLVYDAVTSPVVVEFPRHRAGSVV